MNNRPIKENSFDASPGGAAGAVSYGVPYGTPTGPNQTQDPDHFEKGGKNKAGQSSKLGNMAKDIDTIHSKKDSPTPDEVVSGIKYEMGQQIKKDKALAKQTVLTNLKKDPHYYRDLKMLNVDDKSMVDNMNESKHPNDAPARAKVTPNIEETKKIFNEMGKAYEKKYVVNSQISDVMKQMWKDKQKRSSWKQG